MRTQSSGQGATTREGVRAGRTGPLIGAGVVALFASTVFSGITDAKTPGSTYCFYGKCHRMKSLSETEALVGQEMKVAVSFYDGCKSDRFNPCGLTSSGEMFHPERADNAASPVYPDGTKLLIWSPESGAAAIVRVNNAGPYWGDRKLDVSKATADKLGFSGVGVATLVVRVLDAPTREEATYQKNRSYEPVPGYIGTYASADSASQGAAELLALEALAKRFNNRIADKQRVVASAKAELIAETKSKAVAAREQKGQLATSARQAVIAKAATMGAITIPILKELVELGEEMGEALVGAPPAKAKAASVGRAKVKARREVATARAKPERVYARNASRGGGRQVAAKPSRQVVSQGWWSDKSQSRQRRADSRDRRKSRSAG